MSAIKLFLVAGLAFLAAEISQASVIVTHAEDPARETTSLDHTTVMDFNSLSADTKYTNLVWSDGAGVTGTFDQIYVKGPDVFGGAVTSSGTTVVSPGGTNYSVQSTFVGGANNVVTTNLTLNAPIAYFGLWWSAGDSKNELYFYNGNDLVAKFTTANLLTKLGSSYNGNPAGNNKGQNAGEPYAFVNFYGASGATWDRITFTNNGSSGFEADNYTFRQKAWGDPEYPTETGPVPGVPVETINGTVSVIAPVPEPGTAALLLLASGIFLVRRRSRF